MSELIWDQFVQQRDLARQLRMDFHLVLTSQAPNFFFQPMSVLGPASGDPTGPASHLVQLSTSNRHHVHTVGQNQPSVSTLPVAPPTSTMKTPR